MIKLEESEEYTTVINLMTQQKTCKDCMYFMQVGNKGFCRKEYTNREPDDIVCYNPLFY